MGEAPMIPAEVIQQLRRFHDTIIATEDAFEPLVSQKPEDRLKFTPLDQARCNLLSVFAINSFYWILLRMKGLNPKDNESLANELKRTKDYMARLKQIEDRALAPRLNQRAAASFVRNALWEPKQAPAAQNVEEDTMGDAEGKSVHDDDETGDEVDETLVRNEPAGSKRPLPAVRPSESVEPKKVKTG